jgi:hypothetical protein
MDVRVKNTKLMVILASDTGHFGGNGQCWEGILAGTSPTGWFSGKRIPPALNTRQHKAPAAQAGTGKNVVLDRLGW